MTLKSWKKKEEKKKLQYGCIEFAYFVTIIWKQLGQPSQSSIAKSDHELLPSCHLKGHQFWL